MKTLFYNPFELPCQIRVKSTALGIDRTYAEPYSDCDFADFSELFKMAKCNCFDVVEVYISASVQAYYRPSKKSREKYPVSGWVSLKGMADGGGYLGDEMLYR